MQRRRNVAEDASPRRGACRGTAAALAAATQQQAVVVCSQVGEVRGAHLPLVLQRHLRRDRAGSKPMNEGS
jgi:hypothetical protein